MRQGLFHCRFGDTVILLDLIPDRYRLLRGDGAARFLRLTEGSASQKDKDWLKGNGIDETSYNPMFHPALPTGSALDRTSGGSAILLTAKAAWQQLHYARQLKQQPLHKVLDALAGKRPLAPTHDKKRSLEIAAAAARSKYFVSAEDQCLPRALAMMNMLFRAKLDAMLVFGVTMPFAAHCWVQQDDLVLTDPLDRILQFRPIMVV